MNLWETLTILIVGLSTWGVTLHFLFSRLTQLMGGL